MFVGVDDAVEGLSPQPCTEATPGMVPVAGEPRVARGADSVAADEATARAAGMISYRSGNVKIVARTCASVGYRPIA